MKTILRKLMVAWPPVIFLLLPALTRAETAVLAWVQVYHGPGDGNDEVQGLAVDGSNNVIVTGYSASTNVYSQNDDCVTIKYSSAGVPLWTNRYNGPGNSQDDALAVAVDGSNNVIVTGGSYSSTNYTSCDYWTIKYSSAGVPLWTNRYNGPANSVDYAQAVAVDGSNNVIATGSSASTDVYPYNGDYVTIKYSSAGVPLWTNRYNGPGNSDDEAMAVAVDGSNSVIVAGKSASSGGFPYEYATIKYSSAGVPLWTNRYNGPGASGARARVAVDSSNSVIVMGESFNGLISDFATIKYSSAGVPLWTNRYNGTGTNYDQAMAVAVDGSNNVVVTGFYYATIKYSSAGVPLWTNRYDGPGNSSDEAVAVTVDRGNNVIVTGNSVGSDADYATIKYSSAGMPLWTNRYNEPGGIVALARAVAVDRSNNVIVMGSYETEGGYDHFVTLKYELVSVSPPAITDLKLTNGTFQMRVDSLQPSRLVIEASTNLAGWAPVFTNTTPTNVLFYSDAKASNYVRRFYRAYQSP